MVGKLLIAAWPNGNAVVSSFRKASSYSPPAETTGTFTMTPIPSGTYINSTSWTFTFLCSKCLDSAGSTTFAPSDTTPVLGWAASASAPSKKADHASPIGKHSSQGNYAIDLVKARS
ncbi:CBD9-like protein, partial [Delitschia confertaspora ATCC 74209]